ARDSASQRHSRLGRHRDRRSPTPRRPTCPPSPTPAPTLKLSDGGVVLPTLMGPRPSAEIWRPCETPALSCWTTCTDRTHDAPHQMVRGILFHRVTPVPANGCHQGGVAHVCVITLERQERRAP